jgi:ribosomal protein S18
MAQGCGDQLFLLQSEARDASDRFTGNAETIQMGLHSTVKRARSFSA